MSAFRSTPDAFDVVIVGGAIVGASLAYGLAKLGLEVAVLDEGDDAFRASRGNFGLVWVQNKGLGCPNYARLSLRAVEAWPALYDDLLQTTRVDCAYEKTGGLTLCLTNEEIEFFQKIHSTIQREVGAKHVNAELLDNKRLRELMPAVASDIPGALYSTPDGICNPLYLLRAFHTSFSQMGVTYLGNHKVRQITCNGPNDFEVETEGKQRFLNSGKIVLAAGLGNADLAPMVGLHAPVTPLQGQIVVTERVAPFKCIPNGMLRPTAEGSLLISHSEADVGFDTRIITPTSCGMTARCLRAFPWLKDVHVVRTWAALRVMSPDGHPIYDQSTSCPGAFLTVCHSGVTLSSIHAGEVSGWIDAGEVPETYKVFSAERFNVQQNQQSN